MTKHDYVIGIDQSYTRTGIMVLENKSIVENHEELFKSKTGYEER